MLVTNQHSLSDAEDFTEGYRSLRLGKVVGEPTAGWIIYTWNTTLIDGTVFRSPARASRPPTVRTWRCIHDLWTFPLRERLERARRAATASSTRRSSHCCNRSIGVRRRIRVSIYFMGVVLLGTPVLSFTQTANRRQRRLAYRMAACECPTESRQGPSPSAQHCDQRS